MRDEDGSPDSLGNLAPIRSSSVAVEAARALRDEILRRADGDMLLGSEDELIQRLGISRPTFRQAARLLEYEELLIIRRGVGGGFFGRKPSADVVARMAGIYLLAQGATFEEIIKVQQVLETAALKDLAANLDPVLRARPAEFLAEDVRFRRPYDVADAVRAINRFWRLVAELVGNRAHMLFMQASQAYGGKSSGLTLTPARLDIYVGSLKEMAQAIRDGEGERAMNLSNARGEWMVAWAREDAAR